jgi:hypothetical protein
MNPLVKPAICNMKLQQLKLDSEANTHANNQPVHCQPLPKQLQVDASSTSCHIQVDYEHITVEVQVLDDGKVELQILPPWYPQTIPACWGFKDGSIKLSSTYSTASKHHS